MNITKTIYTEQAAKEYAEKTAETVVIREFKDGNSSDTRRNSTEAEKAIVERAIFAALLSIRGGYEPQSAKATAEFFILFNSGETHINTYDSVYIPIDEFLVANQ
jgi:hypothetical protein